MQLDDVHSLFKKECEATLLENLTDDFNAWLYVTKFSTIFLYLTKLYVT